MDALARSRLLRVHEDFYDYVNGLKKQSNGKLSASKITEKLASDRSLVITFNMRKEKR